MKIKVLGSGCKSCHKLFEAVKKVIEKNNINADVEYIDDIQIMINYGVMNSPVIVINENVVSSGKVLKEKEILSVIQGNATFEESDSCNCGGGCCS